MAHLKHSTGTKSENPAARQWHLVDVSGKRLGRIANVICIYLQGKHKATYAPNIDNGDYVVVTNAKKVTLSGRKNDTKQYSTYSGYPGGLRRVTFASMIEKQPQEVIRRAVSGMLPKNKLRDARLSRLYVFPDEKHPYQDKVKKVS